MTSLIELKVQWEEREGDMMRNRRMQRLWVRSTAAGAQCLDKAGGRSPGLPLALVSSSADNRDVVRLNDVICADGSHCACYVGRTPQIGAITVLRTQHNRGGEGKCCDLGME